jgi:putative Mn2+ efflux pump MntP
LDKLSLAVFSTFTVALLHTAIPSHWLCFVAVGKAQGWRRRQTLMVAALAGVIHVATTIALGVGARAIGQQVLDEEQFELASALLLIGLGLVYLGLHFFHGGHHHDEDRQPMRDRWAVVTLVLAVTISPCTASPAFCWFPPSCSSRPSATCSCSSG